MPVAEEEEAGFVGSSSHNFYRRIKSNSVGYFLLWIHVLMPFIKVFCSMLQIQTKITCLCMGKRACFFQFLLNIPGKMRVEFAQAAKRQTQTSQTSIPANEMVHSLIPSEKWCAETPQSMSPGAGTESRCSLTQVFVLFLLILRKHHHLRESYFHNLNNCSAP